MPTVVEAKNADLSHALGLNNITAAEATAISVDMGSDAVYAYVEGHPAIIRGGGAGWFPATFDGRTTHNVAELSTFDGFGWLTNGYVHLKLPYALPDPRMYDISVRGYSYAQSKLVNIRAVGYLYTTRLQNLNHETNFFPVKQYLGSDNHVYIRIGQIGLYYLTLTVSSIMVGNGRVILPGEIQIIVTELDQEYL